MEPFSYQGFGFTAILLMIAILSISQFVSYLKERNDSKSKAQSVKADTAA